MIAERDGRKQICSKPWGTLVQGQGKPTQSAEADSTVMRHSGRGGADARQHHGLSPQEGRVPSPRSGWVGAQASIVQTHRVQNSTDPTPLVARSPATTWGSEQEPGSIWEAGY